MRPSTLLLHPSGRRRRTRAATRAAAAAAACLLLAGCFTLSPVRMDQELAPGRVRVHLSDSGATRVADAIGGRAIGGRASGGRATVIDGELTGATADEIMLRVPSSGAAGFGNEVLYQDLRLPKREIAGLQRRQLNRMRTGLAVGGVAAVGGFLLYQSLSGKTGGSPGGGTGGPPESRVPLIKLWFW